MTEAQRRIADAYDIFSKRDDLSDEEIVRECARRAGLSYGETNAFLRQVSEVELRSALRRAGVVS